MGTMVTTLDVKPNESFDEYKNRIYDLKASGVIELTWEGIANLFYEKFGIKRDESTWRREYKTSSSPMTDSSSEIDDIESLIMEFRKERVKLQDERTHINACVRKMSREETLKEIATKYAATANWNKILKPTYNMHHEDSDDEGIIQLSDWHYGIEVANILNLYNPDICKVRVNKLLEEAIEFYTLHPVKKLHIVNLGDLISGRIHTGIRIQNRVDVITQTMDVCEILAEFISELTSVAPEIEYIDCLDNHSRIEPTKENSIELESLSRIITWYLDKRFENNHCINIIHNDNFNNDIAKINLLDGKYTALGVHGHKDKIGKVVSNLTLLTDCKPDIILTAHYHHFEAKEENYSLVISNGTLMGVDDYSYDLRKASKPTQNLILVSKDNPAKYICRVICE